MEDEVNNPFGFLIGNTYAADDNKALNF